MKTDTVSNLNVKKKNKVGRALLIIVAFFFFNLFTFPLYMCYGPFKKVRNTFVGTAMGTGNHQYLARIFFSDYMISEILKENNSELNKSTVSSKNTEKISFTDDGSPIQRVDINDPFNAIILKIKDKTKVKVGYSSKLGELGQTVTQMASHYNAIAAINGGGYSDTVNGKSGGTGAIPTGIIISDGKVIYPQDKSEYNDAQMLFSLDSDGNMFVGKATVNQLLKKNVKEAISFDPSLVVDGKPYISATTLQGIQPRTAIGQLNDGSIVFVVVDGRQGLKAGATLQDLRDLMIKLGAVNAMCLDGGGSSTMYLNNDVINNPSCTTGERAMPDIVYVEP